LASISAVDKSRLPENDPTDASRFSGGRSDDSRVTSPKERDEEEGDGGDGGEGGDVADLGDLGEDEEGRGREVEKEGQEMRKTRFKDDE